MKLLLDTHLLLWAASAPDKLSHTAKKLIEAPENKLFFSSVSLWEIVIKHSLGRADFQVDARLLRRGLLTHGYQELSVTSEHAVAVATLPLHHKDSFDRMLIAQSQIEGYILLTSDNTLAQYQGQIQLV
jgi:PIN domain nuclease of toxin-antitoxin system